MMVVLTIASKFFITMAFGTAWQYTTELYPTVIRALGLTSCNLVARIGALVAPYLPLLVMVIVKKVIKKNLNNIVLKYIHFISVHHVKLDM